MAKFVNAVEMSIKHPDTFQVPTKAEIHNLLKEYSHVKVSTGGERFWVLVDSINLETETLKGFVDNNLLYTDEHGLDYGDEVTIHFNEIYSVM